MNSIPSTAFARRSLAGASLALLVACGDSNVLSQDAASVAVAGSTRSVLRATGAPSAAQLMDWAEVNYPQYFPASGKVGEGVYPPYIYRQYDTGNYVGVSTAGEVAVYGNLSGWTIMPVGTVADFACRVLPASCGVTLSGVVAAGTPIGNASVTVTDAGGATAAVATTDAQGRYSVSFDPVRFTPPYVVSATGAVGEASETLVAVHPAAASGDLNLTPLSSAIAAYMSSTGDPRDLPANIATDRLNITAAGVAAVEQSFRQLLAANMRSVGLDESSFHLLNGRFDARFDRLLDAVHVEVAPRGEIRMYSTAGTAVDDLGSSAARPAAAQVLTLARGVRPLAADAAALPALAPGQASVAAADLESIRQAGAACFALPAATRSSSTACTGLARVNYRNNGQNLLQEIGSWFDDVGNDGLQFQPPEILRVLDATVGQEKAQVRISATRADGETRELVTVAARNASGWSLVGNQRDFETYVNANVIERVSVNTPAARRFETGLVLFVRQDPAITSAVVTGPGLPDAGITLVPKPGCDFLAIVDPATGAPALCNSTYRLRALLANGSPLVPSPLLAYFYGARSDAEIAAIRPLELYKFVLQAEGGTVTHWNRLRARPLTMDEMGNVAYAQFTEATRTLMRMGSLYAGGAPPTLAWTVPAKAPRPGIAMFFHRAGSDFIRVPLTATSAAVPCSDNSECAGSGYVGTISSGLAPADSFHFQLVARNRFDLQVFSQLAR